MAINRFVDPRTGIVNYSGLSTDTKPPAFPGAQFWETDTFDRFECYGGSVWFITWRNGHRLTETLRQSHAFTHEGRMFSATHRSDIPTMTSEYHLIQVPSGTDMHMGVAVRTNGELDFDGFSGPTFSAAGTSMTVINNNFNFALVTPNTVLTSAPTVTGEGTLGYPDLIPGGSGGNAVGGEVNAPGGGAEFVLNGGTDFLIKLTNNSGGTVRHAISIVFYERDVS